jgi:hypothetical protein
MSTDQPVQPPSRTARAALEWLESESDPATLDAMSGRYGIHTDRALGVPMAKMKVLAKRLGTDHGLAAELLAGWFVRQ